MVRGTLNCVKFTPMIPTRLTQALLWLAGCALAGCTGWLLSLVALALRTTGVEWKDWLQFAGGLLGAAASVGGAFAVVSYSAGKEQREFRSYIRETISSIKEDCDFLTAMIDCTIESADYAGLARRIDAIAVSVPATSDFLDQERLELRLGSARAAFAILNFRSALRTAKGEFDGWSDRRRRWRFNYGDEDLTVEVNREDIELLHSACETALANLD